jgi:hypothetical protein
VKKFPTKGKIADGRMYKEMYIHKEAKGNHIHKKNLAVQNKKAKNPLFSSKKIFGKA